MRKFLILFGSTTGIRRAPAPQNDIMGTKSDANLLPYILCTIFNDAFGGEINKNSFSCLEFSANKQADG